MKTGRQREVQSGRQEGIARETERERKKERKGETDRGVREGDRLRDRERRRGSEIGGWNQRTTEDETGRQTGGETRETESEREISGERQVEGRGGYLCYCTFRWSAFPSTFCNSLFEAATWTDRHPSIAARSAGSSHHTHIPPPTPCSSRLPS